jgi:hypothetical protein
VTIPTPTISTGETATPSAVTGAVSIPTPTIHTDATVTPATVTGAVSIPTPAVFTVAQAHWFVLGDGWHEIPLTLEGVWNGTSIDALTFDEVTA